MQGGLYWQGLLSQLESFGGRMFLPRVAAIGALHEARDAPLQAIEVIDKPARIDPLSQWTAFLFSFLFFLPTQMGGDHSILGTAVHQPVPNTPQRAR
ncbi:MAG: hypothetical protein ACO3JG_02795 [Luteolibacter sp.]